MSFGLYFQHNVDVADVADIAIARACSENKNKLLRIHILIPHAGVPSAIEAVLLMLLSNNLGFTPCGQLNYDLLARFPPKVTQIHHNDGAQVRL